MESVQRRAAAVIGNVLAGRSLDAELAQLWLRDAVPAADRPLLQELCYGTLRFLGPIDAVLDRLLDKPPRSERLRQLLRVALYQLMHTRAAPHAVVDHAVRACVPLREAAAGGLVNAVLRSFLRRRDMLEAAARETDTGRYSHPQWWVDKLRAQYPERFESILEAANGRPPLTLRVNRRASSVDAYLARLAAADIGGQSLGGVAVALERALPVERIPGFTEGAVSVQDAGAQYAAPLLDAPEGARVLDACAAPGGKAAHILERADVDLVALDSDAARLTRVTSNLKRLHLAARVVRGNAADPHGWWDGRPYSHILADVPCTASGVARRHPDIKWLRRPTDIDALAERQREILDALWRTLAPGGKLLYATCSLFDEENGAQIGRFLERHHDARRLPLPRPHTNAKELAGQMLPDAYHDGFFYALLQKS